MSVIHPAQKQLAMLRQGIDLVSTLTGDLYASRPDLPSTASVGGHFRHCLDAMDAFVEGLPAGRVDYDCRERDARTECEPAVALARASALAEALTGLADIDPAQSLQVRMETDAAGDSGWHASTLGREWLFLLSHTVHHYALIAVTLRRFGRDVDPAFGVAPATLEYRKSATQAAS